MLEMDWFLDSFTSLSSTLQYTLHVTYTTYVSVHENIILFYSNDLFLLNL